MDGVATVTNGGAGDGVGGEHAMNGDAHLDEEERLRMRPADVDADMREMSRRKRVDAILTSKSFRTELDRLIESGTLESGSMGGCLQQITDMMGSLRGGSGLSNGVHCVQPIADLRGLEASQFSKVEKMMRCKMSALMRLMDLNGWTNTGHSHVTLRITQDLEHFLVNPVGLLYSEVSASSLLKLDMQGCVVHPGSCSGLHVQRPGGGFCQLHAPVHAARPDLRCVAHLQQPSVVAVSALRDGILPLTEHACALGAVSQLSGPLDQLDRQLGVHNKVILLPNRGALCCGETVEETFFLMKHLVAACETQVRMMPLGVDNLVLLDDEQRRAIHDELRQPVSTSCDTAAADGPTSLDSNGGDPAAAAGGRGAWKLGEMEFEALMRQLDNCGYRTGHMYRHPVRSDLPLHQSDVEYPPAASSYTYDTDDVFKYSPMRKMFAGLRSSERTRWLNSPNAYQKVEILEAGTRDPKKITKWVPDGSPAHGSNPIKVDLLQFVPKNTNPKEFKQLQQQIKENRRAGGISAGPQSHILEGVSWDEARQMQDAAESKASDQVVLVGAASKGIIQRDYQHHATVYKTPYAKNPFDQVTDEDINDYKRTVEMKSRGDSVDTEPVVSSSGVVAQHAERVELASDGEDADISRSSAAPAAADSCSSADRRVDRVLTSQTARPAVAITVTLPIDGEAAAANGDEHDTGHLSTVSHTDQEDVSTSEASKKDKKKKKGLRTPSFLKKKKDKKRDKKDAFDTSK